MVRFSEGGKKASSAAWPKIKEAPGQLLSRPAVSLCSMREAIGGGNAGPRDLRRRVWKSGGGGDHSKEARRLLIQEIATARGAGSR